MLLNQACLLLAVLGFTCCVTKLGVITSLDVFLVVLFLWVLCSVLICVPQIRDEKLAGYAVPTASRNFFLSLIALHEQLQVGGKEYPGQWLQYLALGSQLIHVSLDYSCFNHISVNGVVVDFPPQSAHLTTEVMLTILKNVILLSSQLSSEDSAKM